MTTNWKSLLTEAESLTKANGKSAWRTAQIVRDLFKSEDFLSQAAGGILDDRDGKLAKFSGRFALGLNDMIQMIEHFPDLKEWESGRLDILRDKTCVLLGKKTAKTTKSATRRSVTVAEYEALKRKYKALQAHARQLEKELAAAKQMAKRKVA